MRLADVFVAVRADMTDVNQAFKGLESSLGGVQRSLGMMGASLTRNVTLPILAVSGATSKLALDFERTMGQLVGLAGVPAGEIDSLRESIMALSSDTGRGPQELAEAFYFVASAGFEADEAMEVLEVSARSAAAGMGETQDIARVLGQAINSYGRENLDAARAADVLTAAVTEGSAEASSYAAALPTVIGSAVQLGVSWEQLLGVVSAMTITTKDAQQATVGLNAIFTTLLNPTSEARDALSGVGLSAEGLRDMLADPAQGTVAVLRLLEERFGGNIEAMGTVFGETRALRGAFSLLSLDADQLDGIMGNVAQSVGDNADAFAAIPEDVLAFDRAMADLQVQAILLGRDVLPTVVDVLKRAADGVRTAVTWWKGLSSETKDTIIQFALFAAAAGPVLTILSKFIGLAKGVVGAAKLMAGGVKLAQRIHREWPTILGHVDDVLLKSKGAFLAVRGAAQSFASVLIGPVGIAIAAFALGMQTDFLGMRTRFEKDMKDMGDAANRFAMTFGEQGERTQEVADRMGISADELRDRVNSAMSQLGVDFETALAHVRREASATGDVLDESAEKYEDYGQRVVVSARETRGAVVAESTDMFGNLVTVFEDGTTAVNGEFTGMTEEQLQAAREMREAVVQSYADMLTGLSNLFETDESVRDAFQALIDRMDDPYTEAERKADIFGQNTIDLIRGAIQSGDPGVTADTTTLVNNMLGQIELMEPGSLASGEAVPPAIRDGMDSSMNELINWIEQTLVPEGLDSLTMEDADKVGLGNIWRYADGMRRNRTLAAAEARAVAARARIALEEPDFFGSGYNVGATWAAGLRAATYEMYAAAREAGWGVYATLGIQSEPKDPNSPLRGITKWGGNAAMTWIDGWMNTLSMGRTRLGQWASVVADVVTEAGKQAQAAFNPLTTAPSFAGLPAMAGAPHSSLMSLSPSSVTNQWILNVEGTPLVIGTKQQMVDTLTKLSETWG